MNNTVAIYIPPHRRPHFNNSDNEVALPPDKISQAASQTFDRTASNNDLAVSTRILERDPLKEEPTEDQKIIGGRIKNADVVTLLGLAKGPVRFNGKKVLLNHIHWAQIVSRLTQKGVLEKDKEGLDRQIVSEMRHKLKQCPFSSAAQIIKSLMTLKITDAETQAWILSLTYRALKIAAKSHSIKQEELFMFLQSSVHILSARRLSGLLKLLEPYLFDLEQKATPLYTQMRSNTKVNLLICYSRAGIFNRVALGVWDDLKNQTLALNEALFLLNRAKLRSCIGIKDFIKEFDERLQKEDLGKEDMIHAWTGFAKQRYHSERLGSQVDRLLKYSNTSCWDKILILYGCALLNLNYTSFFKSLLEELKDYYIDSGKIYLRDKLKLLYTASIFLSPEDAETKYLAKIADQLGNEELSKQDQRAVYESLNILRISPIPSWQDIEKLDTN